MNIQKTAEKVSHLHSEYRTVESLVKNERSALRKCKKKLEYTLEAQSILQTVAKSVQTLAHGKIATIATSCLAAVFDDPPKLTIEFIQARGKTEARIKLSRNDVVLDDPLDEESAGAVSVAVFALRLADLILSQPARRRVLILDEPFSGIATSLGSKVAGMLKKLTEELDLQVIMTTHNKDFEVGKVIKL